MKQSIEIEELKDSLIECQEQIKTCMEEYENFGKSKLDFSSIASVLDSIINSLKMKEIYFSNTFKSHSEYIVLHTNVSHKRQWIHSSFPILSQEIGTRELMRYTLVALVSICMFDSEFMNDVFKLNLTT